MIASIRLKFGPEFGSKSEPIPVTPLVVFVGPNNSGKSCLLREIERYCMTGLPDVASTVRSLVLDSVEFREVDESLATKLASRLNLIRQNQHDDSESVVIASPHGSRQGIAWNELIGLIMSPTTNRARYCQTFLKNSTLSLNGQNRLSLFGEKPASDLQQPPENSLQALFWNDAGL